MNIDLKSLNIQEVLEAVKELAGMTSSEVIGLDIGLSSVKAAYLSRSGDSYTLTNYASVPLPEGCMIEDEVQNEEDLVEAIQSVISKLKSPVKQVCLGLFGPNTVMRRLQLAGGTPDEVEDQVLWEADQYLPFPVEDSNIDHYLVGENEGGGIDVIVAAARKDILLTFKDITELSGVKVKLVDLSAVAVSNVFSVTAEEELSAVENEYASWLVLDIGAQKCTALIYKGGMPVFMKEIGIGGAMVTEEIQRQLGVNYSEAEDLKITVDEEGNLPEEILSIITDINETFINEIKRTIDFYINSTSDDSLVSCYLTGGSVKLPGLLEGLNEALGLSVSVLNPFTAIGFDEKRFDEAMLSEIAYHGAVAIGLGMRQLHD